MTHFPSGKQKVNTVVFNATHFDAIHVYTVTPMVKSSYKYPQVNPGTVYRGVERHAHGIRRRWHGRRYGRRSSLKLPANWALTVALVPQLHVSEDKQ
jgi:hypothetical protein